MAILRKWQVPHPMETIKLEHSREIWSKTTAWAGSFNTREAALQNYFEAKRLGLVKVSRLPGDEDIFGPISEAEL